MYFYRFENQIKVLSGNLKGSMMEKTWQILALLSFVTSHPTEHVGGGIITSGVYFFPPSGSKLWVDQVSFQNSVLKILYYLRHLWRPRPDYCPRSSLLGLCIQLRPCNSSSSTVTKILWSEMAFQYCEIESCGLAMSLGLDTSSLATRTLETLFLINLC